MPVPRMSVEDTALIVIDVQEKLAPTIVDIDMVVQNCSLLLRMAKVLRMPYLVTEHYPRGLGRSVEPIGEAMTDQSNRVEKTRFTALVDVVEEQLCRWRRQSVIVAGLEAHVCVLQTVLDIQASGRQAFVCTDAISASQRGQIEPAIRRMEAAGALPTGTLSIMYELLGDASHPDFRTILGLAKAVRQ